MFVRLYILLLIHCIYVSVTKPTCPAFSAWLNTGSIRHLKVTGKAIMLCSVALPSKLCAALIGQSHTGQCKRTDGFYNELVVAFFSTGGCVKGKQIYTC